MIEDPEPAPKEPELPKRAKEDESGGETKSAKKWGNIFRKFDEGK